MKIIYDDSGEYTKPESNSIGHHSFEDVSSDSVRTPGARKPVRPVRRPAPTLRPTVRKPEETAAQVPQQQMPQTVYAPLPYIQGGAQPTMPVQGYPVQPYALTPEQMAALAQQYPQGYPVYVAPQQGYIQPQYVQYQPQVQPIAQSAAAVQNPPAQPTGENNTGTRVLYQSPDFDRPEKESDTVSPSYTEPLQTGMVHEDVDFSEETISSPAKKSTSGSNAKKAPSAFEEDDVEMSVFQLNSITHNTPSATVKAVRQPVVKKPGINEEEYEQYYEDESDSLDPLPEPKKKISVSEIIRRTVLTISIIAIVVAAAMLVNEYRLSKENRDVMEEVSNLIIEEATTQETTKETTTKKATKENKTTKQTTTEVTTTAPLTPAQQWEQIKAEYPNLIFPANLQLKYARLYATNQDFVGYLSADGVGLNLPVVQTDNDEEYLEKNFYGSSTKYGCPFVTHLNNIDELDTNTIIFGHHMNDGTVFGALDEYKSIEGFREAPVITFNTLYKDYQWKIIAAFITNAYKEDDNDYVFRYYFTNLSTEERYSAFLNELSQRSLYDTGIDVLPTDKILTLSTCSHEFEEARFVVVARLVRNGESSEVDVSMATVNPNPRYPQAYYDEEGMENPYKDAYRWEVG